VPSANGGLARTLSLFDAISIVVGSVIGSAIFLIPSTLLKANSSPLAAILVLLFAGVLSYFGALAYAELAGMFPATGGEYVFLRESWGPLWGFLCGWAYFLITQTGGLAAVAAGFAALTDSVFRLGQFEAKLCAATMLVALTTLNYYGVKAGARVNNLMTIAKVVGIGAIAGAVALKPTSNSIDWSWPNHWSTYQFAAALVPALWCFEGWNIVTFVAGEVRSPKRDIPRALAYGIIVVLLVYLVSFSAFVKALPVGRIVTSNAVAADVGTVTLGSVGGVIITITMLVSLAGCANATILAAPRLYFAMAQDGLLFRSFAHLHSVYRTPSRALLYQCVWAVVLTLTGSYEVLLSYCTFGAWIFYAMVVGGLLILRNRRPEVISSYRMWGYPYTPICFLLVAIAFIGSTFFTAPLTSLAGVGLIATGIPFFYLRRQGSSSRQLGVTSRGAASL
jgi:APA family basic amino acid/polyamine antiporter